MSFQQPYHPPQYTDKPVESPSCEENREALLLWHRVIVEGVRNDDYDLSARQLAILLTLNNEAGSHTIKSLSVRLGISKAPVSRALNSLSKHDLIERKVDINDRRNIYILLTDDGKAYLKKLSNRIMNCLVEI